VKMIARTVREIVEPAAARQTAGPGPGNVQDEGRLPFVEDEANAVQAKLLVAQPAARELPEPLPDRNNAWPPSKTQARQRQGCPQWSASSEEAGAGNRLCQGRKGWMPESPVAEQRSFVELVPLDETSRGKGSRGRDQLQVHGQVRLELERGRTTFPHSRVVHGHVEHQHDACGTRFWFGLLRPGRREPSRPQSLEMCRVVVFAGLMDE
jgi:hypothetical protein